MTEQQAPDEVAPRIQLLRSPGSGGGVLSFLRPVQQPSLYAEDQLGCLPKQSFSVLLTKSVSLIFVLKAPWVQ